MWKKENGLWYYYKNNIKVCNDWVQDKGKWYYLEKDGRMVKGWFQTVKDGDRWFYAKDNGEMATGWIQLNNKWYYLEEQSNGHKGACYVNGTYTVGGKSYTFNDKGVWIENNSLVSDALIDFIKSWEGFSAIPYQDEVGVWTLGYGMTGEEIQGLSSITESQATQMLKDWIDNKYAPVIKADLDSKGITLKQNEFDALISFAYNCGTVGLLGSTLYKNLVAGVRDSATIISNFKAWSNGGGQRIEGLYRRRIKEAAMFLNADYTGNA